MPKKVNSKEWISPTEIARDLGLSNMTVYRLLTDVNPVIPWHQFGRSKRVHIDDYNEYKKNSRRS